VAAAREAEHLVEPLLGGIAGSALDPKRRTNALVRRAAAQLHQGNIDAACASLQDTLPLLAEHQYGMAIRRANSLRGDIASKAGDAPVVQDLVEAFHAHAL
jgi:predicted TPR repeat methyltransferase